MLEISDEMLMSYADGALGPAERSMIDERVRSDEVLLRRLRVFEVTGRSLARLYDPVFSAPVPDQLIDSVRTGRACVRPASSFGPKFVGAVRDAVRSFLSEGQGLALAGACALVLVAGAAAVHMRNVTPHSSPVGALLANENGQSVAKGEFRLALETLPSNAPARFAGSDTSAAVSLLSFKSRDGSYCRKYQLRDHEGQMSAGVACRDGSGAWRIDVEARVAHVLELERALAGKPGPDKSVVAGAEGSDSTAGTGAQKIEERIDSLISGAALGTSEEADQLKKSWGSQPH